MKELTSLALHFLFQQLEIQFSQLRYAEKSQLKLDEHGHIVT